MVPPYLTTRWCAAVGTMWIWDKENICFSRVSDNIFVVFELFYYGYVGAILTESRVLLMPFFLFAHVFVPPTIGAIPIVSVISFQMVHNRVGSPRFFKVIDVNFDIALRSLCDPDKMFEESARGNLRMYKGQ